MIKIDWRMAPDWADGHGLIAHQGITEVWINMDQYAVVGREGGPYPYGGGTGDTRHNHTRGQIQYITPRPDRWDGKGLPPVGILCEYRTGYASEPPEYKACEVIAHFGEEALRLAAYVFTQHDGTRLIGQGTTDHFRPLRTPEQIAEAERIAGLNEMIRNIKDHPNGVHGVGHLQQLMIHEDVARDLWAAGYRKQEDQ